MSRRLVDTNLVIRYLVQDNVQQARAATALFEACDRGQLRLLLLPAVLAECVFVLESFYEHGRRKISEVLIGLIESPGILLADQAIHADALKRYSSGKLHFVDCVIAAAAAANGISVATFDNELGKLSDIRVQIE